MSRWSNWSRGSKPGLSLSGFLAEGPVDQLRTGNPTGNGTLEPADRAKQLGLQSDGKGGYIDPKTGQVVARTVNNELVFYSTGPTGGAVSDGSGGAAMASPSSSWQDPITGMMITPPSRAETPNEIAAIPDAVPAVAPAGYNEFMQGRKQQQYFDDFIAREKQKLMAQQPQMPMAAPETDPGMAMQPADPAMAPQPGMEMPMEDYTPQDLLKRSGGMGPPTFSDLRDRVKRSQEVPEPAPQPQQQAQPEQPDRQEILRQRLAGITGEGDKKHGAGANLMSLDDLGSLKNYIQNGPQNQVEDISDEDLDFAMDYLKLGAGNKWKGFQSRLKGKGAPPAELKTAERAREIVRSYLANMGQSSVDGSDLLFSESELDHGLSLSNGGLDEAGNWRWLPRRYNQFKGDLEDDALLDKIEKEIERQNSPDFQIKQTENENINQSRADWRERFEDSGWEDLSAGDLREKKGEIGLQFLKAMANNAGLSYWKQRPTRASGRPGGATSMTAPELAEMLIDKLGIPELQDIEKFDKGMFDLLQKDEDARSRLDSLKRARQAEKRKEKKSKGKQLKEFLAPIEEEHEPVEGIDGTSGKERIPLYAMKRHVVDNQPIDRQMSNDIRSTYPDVSDDNLNSARAHAANFKSLLDQREISPEARQRLRFGRVGESMPEFEGLDDTRVGQRMSRIFSEMNPEVKERLYKSPDMNSWNPTDIYAIDGDYEDEFLSNIEQLRTNFQDDDEGFMSAINALGRRAMSNGQYFPISLKAITDEDGEGQSIPENLKEYVEDPADTAVLSMLNRNGIRMNLDLVGRAMKKGNEDGFKSSSLNIPVMLGLDGGDYGFDMRFQEIGGKGNYSMDPRKAYRNEAQPVKRGGVDLGKHKIRQTDMPKEVNPTAKKYQPTEPKLSGPQKSALEALEAAGGDEDALTKSQQNSLKKARENIRKANAENDRRAKQLETDQKSMGDDLVEFRKRQVEAEENRGITADDDSKIGMIPTNYLREWVGELIGDDSHLKDMGIDVGEEEMGEYSPSKVEQKLLDRFPDILDDETDLDSLGLAKTNLALAKDYRRKKGEFYNRDRRTYNPRDFSMEERENLRNMLTSLYNYTGDMNFDVAKPDLQIGNKTYNKENIGDYIDDLLDLDQETRMENPEDRRLTNEWFGEDNDFGDLQQLQSRIRLALLRMKITNGLKDAHIRGDLPKRIAQAFQRGSKTKSNNFFPYYKMEKKRKKLDESFDWQETQYLIYY